ncbi:MAG: hypothetical protein PHS26_05000 [Actinomycetota bacterium]|nr:hypothetical protein [Actinomycetota bacterium]
MVTMQLGMDMIKLLFFPGLLFLAACGVLLLFLEGWLQVAFLGGRGPRPRDLAAAGEAPSPGELASLVVPPLAMGICGVLLVGARGDLFALVLLFSSVEAASLYLVAAGGEDRASYVPLCFRTALCRVVALSCVALSLSLRFPGAFSSGLETLRGEGAPWAVQLWDGPGFPLVAASVACAGLSLLLFLLGRPAGTGRRAGKEDHSLAYPRAVIVEGPQRAAGLLLFVVVFLGYPWEGGTGKMLWAGSVLGFALLVTAARAWAEGRGGVLVRRLQGVAALIALLSVGLAFAAVILSGR